MIASMANRTFSFWRRTSYIMEATTATATMATTRTLPDGSYVQITVDNGTTGSGTVTINGVVAGSPDTEVLTFTKNGTQVGTKKWASVSSLTTTGLADEATVPTVAAQSVSSDGTPNFVRYSVKTGCPVMFSFQGSPNDKALRPGSNESDGAVISIDFDAAWRPQPDDVAIDDLTSDEWQVRGVRSMRLGWDVRRSYLDLKCTRLQT